MTVHQWGDDDDAVDDDDDDVDDDDADDDYVDNLGHFLIWVIF